MQDYKGRLLAATRIMFSRMRKDPALLDKARGIAKQELRIARKLNPPVTTVEAWPRAASADVRRLQAARIRGTYYETWWVELLRPGNYDDSADFVDSIERIVCRDGSDFCTMLCATSPFMQMLSPQERDFVEHGFDNWWVEHVAEIRENRVYGNSEGEQRLVVSVSGSMENSVVVWRTPDPDLPIGAKAQGSATVASFRRWATKVRPATQDDWDAFSKVERGRRWHKNDAAFYRRYRQKHQTASAY